MSNPSKPQDVLLNINANNIKRAQEKALLYRMVSLLYPKKVCRPRLNTTYMFSSVVDGNADPIASHQHRYNHVLLCDWTSILHGRRPSWRRRQSQATDSWPHHGDDWRPNVMVWYVVRAKAWLLRLIKLLLLIPRNESAQKSILLIPLSPLRWLKCKYWTNLSL